MNNVKNKNRLAAAILETASDMCSLGIIDKFSHEKIARRHQCEIPNPHASSPPRMIAATLGELADPREADLPD